MIEFHNTREPIRKCTAQGEREEEKGEEIDKRELTGIYVWSGRTGQSQLRRGSSKGEKDAVRCTT